MEQKQIKIFDCFNKNQNKSGLNSVLFFPYIKCKLVVGLASSPFFTGQLGTRAPSSLFLACCLGSSALC